MYEPTNAIYWRSLKTETVYTHKKETVVGTWVVTEENNGFCYFGREVFDHKDAEWQMHAWFDKRENAIDHVVECIMTARADGWRDI